MVHWHWVEHMDPAARDAFEEVVRRTSAEWAEIERQDQELEVVRRRQQLEELRMIGDVIG